MDWSDALTALRTGRVEVVPMFRSEARGERFRFTEPFFYVTHAVYGSPGEGGLAGPNDFTGQRVAVVRQGFAMQRLAREGVDAVPVPRASIPGALKAVVNERAEVALVAKPTANRVISESGFGLEALGPPLWPRPYVFAVAQGRPDLHQWLTRNFRLTVTNGRYQEIYARWQGDLTGPPSDLFTLLWRFAYVIGPLVLIAGLGFLWSWQLRRRVFSRTRELNEELQKRRAAEDRIRYWANHDALTGLPSRARFVRKVEEAFSAKGHSATGDEADPGLSGFVLTVRLPELDSLISAFGYGIGEGILERFAERLARQGSGVAGHFGRGVFGLALPASLNPEDVMVRLGEPIEVGGMELDPHLAAGVCRFPKPEANVDELVRCAEMAMAEASSRNRPWLEYEPNLEPDPNDLLIVGEFKRYAPQGLRVVLQPQVDLETGEVVGAEALVRWNHPDLGEISPARFVPLLERAGTTHRLTQFMVDQAVALATELRGARSPLPISVNVSVVDLIDDDLGGLIGAILSEWGGSPDDLCIEMTETAVIENPGQVCAVVQDLRDQGIGSSLDDFGVGYSSLGYLSDFPIDEIKIDQRFVQNMVRYRRDWLIVHSTVSLAHSLGLRVVAEGVEDGETIEALRQAGCDRAQGYAFSAPVRSEDLRQLVGYRFEGELPGGSDPA